MPSLALDAASSVLFGYTDRANYRTLGQLIASWLSTAFQRAYGSSSAIFRAFLLTAS